MPLALKDMIFGDIRIIRTITLKQTIHQTNNRLGYGCSFSLFRSTNSERCQMSSPFRCREHLRFNDFV
jgi:hypothetical protein